MQLSTFPVFIFYINEVRAERVILRIMLMYCKEVEGDGLPEAWYC